MLRELAGDGYRCSFVIRPDARVQCTACRATSAAGDLEPEQTRRLEGASDPDDALLVVAAHCPACEAGATVVLGFGPAASDDDSLVVAQLVLDR